MSLTLAALAPKTYSPFRVGDDAPKSGSFAAVLGTDTITGTPTVTITRKDGVTPGSGDLTIVGSPTVDTTNQIVTVRLDQGIVGVTYIITFSIATAAGNIWYRDAYLPVVANLG